MFALRDVSQNLANLETAANFFNFKKFVRRFIIDIIVPDGVDKIDASFGAGLYNTKAEASPATEISVIDISNNKRTYPGVKSIILNTVSVKAKNSQFPDVEAVRFMPGAFNGRELRQNIPAFFFVFYFPFYF